MSDILYFRILMDNGRVEYLAADSEKSVRDHLGDPKDPFSSVAMFGHRLETLEQITEKEAAAAPEFKELKQHPLGLSADGTYILGAVPASHVF